MKRILQSSFVLVLFLQISCNTIKISSEFDDTVDFPQYNAYQLSDRALDLPLNKLNGSVLISAIETQMEEKGFTKTNNNQLIVDVYVNTEDRMEDNSYMTGYGGFAKNNPRYKHYVVGSIFLLFIDKADNQLVWQGVAEGTVTEKEEKVEDQIREAVAKIFEKYPPAK